MRVTYIQPVFDRRVQHGEVGEEDTQVGHGALGVGLCNRKKKKVFHPFPPEVSIHSPHSEGFQSSRLQLFFKRWRWLGIHHTHTHTHDRPSVPILRCVPVDPPYNPPSNPLTYPLLSKSGIRVNVWMQRSAGEQYFQVLLFWNPLSSCQTWSLLSITIERLLLIDLKIRSIFTAPNMQRWNKINKLLKSDNPDHRSRFWRYYATLCPLTFYNTNDTFAVSYIIPKFFQGLP